MTTSKHNIEELIHEKEALLAKFQSLKSKRGGVQGQLDGIRHKLINAKKLVNAYPVDKKETLNLRKAAQESLDQLLDNEKMLIVDINHFETEIEHTEAALEKLNTSASADQLFSFIQQIENAESEVSVIEGKIQDQQQLINSLADDSEEQLTSLQQKRIQLLADISLDKAKKSDLEKLDDEISNCVHQSSKEHSKNHPIERDANQLIQGLLPHKQAAATKLAHLKSDLPKVIEAFLIGHAEEQSKHYLKQCTSLIRSFYALKSIETIRKEMKLNQEDPFFIQNSINALTMPSMNLSVFKQCVQSQPAQNILFRSDTYTEENNNLESLALKEMNDKFEKLGLMQVFEMLDN